MKRWRMALFAAVPLVMGVAIAGGILAQAPQSDPRNTSDAYFDAVNGAECMAHHLEDGFIPFGFRFLETYTQLPINETVTIRVEISHITQYEGPHMVTDMAVTVDTTEASNVVVMDADPPEDVAETWTRTLAHAQTLANEVFIGHGAFEGALTARVVSTDPPLSALGLPGTLELNAGGRTAHSDTGFAKVDLDQDFFLERGPGNQSFQATWRSEVPMLPVTATVEKSLFVNHTVGTEFTFPAPDPVLATIGDRTTVEIPVRILSEEQAVLDFRVRGTAFWEHNPGDGASLDDGVFHRFLTMNVTGGDEAVAQEDPQLLPAPPLALWLVVAAAALLASRRWTGRRGSHR